MAKRNEILSRYSQSAQLAESHNQKLMPAEYMLATNPGANQVNYRGKVYYSKYKNADSASRAFRKLKSGETSGERIYKQAEMYPMPKARGGRGEDLGYEMRPGRGLRQVGLWKVTVFMAWEDAEGNSHGRYYDEDTDEEYFDYNSLEARSFVVETANYTSSLDAKTVEYEVWDAIQDHVAQWENEYNVGNVEVVYVETIMIQTYHVDPSRVTTLW